MKNFFHFSARCMRRNTFHALVMATTRSVMMTLTALLASGCATQTFEQPASLGADLKSRAGVAPGWTLPEAKLPSSSPSGKRSPSTCFTTPGAVSSDAG